MDEKKKGNSAASKNRMGNFFALRLAVSAYLIYLGVDILRDYLSGASTLPPGSAWGFGTGFIVAGVCFAVYSFIRYRRETEAENAKGEETGKTPDER